ncbi:MAG: thioredoxin domain-containing protein [Nitrosomonadales bacterium]|nr:MAG: thioredoxin domain-containing protein [Nitrosomonadales bacterium]
MPNHLINETSPYLLQHAYNPVDWYPWCDEALALARTENKAILLSIGYSACHWCHVMAHESFEDVEVAAVMNQFFVNIKVDREERPDLDQIYQTAHHMLTQRNGGWPLTLFLTPDQKPFFGGTYFPKISRHGLPSFLDLLPRVAEAYYARGVEIKQQSVSMLESFANMLPLRNSSVPVFSDQPLHQALIELKERFDSEYGGFGNAPKFPHSAELEFCLRRYIVTNDKQALQIASHTLEKMAKGGIYDQLGGGFCRYSTDQHWRIPHFEKMLYDNGPLLRIYAEAWLITGNPLFKRITEETAKWVLREMQSSEDPGGGYYSTLDADSEDEEGKIYVWDRDQIINILSPEEYAVVAHYYGLLQSPNFESKYWNLEIIQQLEKVAKDVGISENEAQERLVSASRKLLTERESRVHPSRDEKILTSWNGLMIKGMARAGRILGHNEWINSAALAVDFIRSTLWSNGRLLATYKSGNAHLNAYLDDYAFMLDGLLELMQAEFRQSDLDFSLELAEVLLEKFESKKTGGFFFTSHDHEKLIHRPMLGHDNATPSGNGVAAYALQRLGYLVGEPRYLQAAENVVNVFYPAVSLHTSSYCSILMTLEEMLVPPKIVILRGQESALTEWRNALQNSSPYTLIFSLPAESVGLPPSLNKPCPNDKPVNAWVCQGVVCHPEISDLQELQQACKFQGKM